MRNCAASYCPQLVPAGTRYCAAHQGEYEARRGTANARGYDQNHRRLRAKWAKKIRAGGVRCARCGHLIGRDTPFDLGHDDTDRSRYTGPEHPSCNRAAGGRSAHPKLEGGPVGD